MHCKEKKYSLSKGHFMCIVGMLVGYCEEVTTVSYNLLGGIDQTDAPDQNPPVIDLSEERHVIRGFGATNILFWRHQKIVQLKCYKKSMWYVVE
jgi:hypothetical protein